MKVTPYLQFTDGNCRQALAFYEKVLGGTVTGSMNFGEAPDGSPAGPEWNDKVMHAHFEAGGVELFACDSPPQWQQKPAGVALTLTADTDADAERIFAALAEGGTVTMEMEETFWASRFGMLTDRFGMNWMVSCDKAVG
jgi:PhnB protein